MRDATCIYWPHVLVASCETGDLEINEMHMPILDREIRCKVTVEHDACGPVCLGVQ